MKRNLFRSKEIVSIHRLAAGCQLITRLSFIYLFFSSPQNNQIKVENGASLEMIKIQKALWSYISQGFCWLISGWRTIVWLFLETPCSVDERMLYLVALVVVYKKSKGVPDVPVLLLSTVKWPTKKKKMSMLRVVPSVCLCVSSSIEEIRTTSRQCRLLELVLSFLSLFFFFVFMYADRSQKSQQ